MDRAIAIVKPGVTTADVVGLWPKGEELGSRSRRRFRAGARPRCRPLDLGAADPQTPDELRRPRCPGGGRGLRARDLVVHRRRLARRPASRRRSSSQPTAAPAGDGAKTSPRVAPLWRRTLKVSEWAGQRLAEVLQLGVAHGLEPLLWTLRRAVEFRRWHAADVRSILASGGAAPSPQSASQY